MVQPDHDDCPAIERSQLPPNTCATEATHSLTPGERPHAGAARGRIPLVSVIEITSWAGRTDRQLPEIQGLAKEGSGAAVNGTPRGPCALGQLRPARPWLRTIGQIAKSCRCVQVCARTHTVTQMRPRETHDLN